MNCYLGMVVPPMLLVAFQPFAVADGSIAAADSTRLRCRDLEARLLAALADIPERIPLRSPAASIEGEPCAEQETVDIEGMPKPLLGGREAWPRRCDRAIGRTYR
jgi:hypothetical protein